jgi:hypothetical protein
VIGADGAESISVEDVARQANTIPYEITCSFGRRVQRLYLGGENLTIPSQRAPLLRAAQRQQGAVLETRHPPTAI